MTEKILCVNCHREFERQEPAQEFDELDPSGRVWFDEPNTDMCPNCKEDLGLNEE